MVALKLVFTNCSYFSWNNYITVCMNILCTICKFCFLPHFHPSNLPLSSFFSTLLSTLFLAFSSLPLSSLHLLPPSLPPVCLSVCLILEIEPRLLYAATIKVLGKLFSKMEKENYKPN